MPRRVRERETSPAGLKRGKHIYLGALLGQVRLDCKKG